MKYKFYILIQFICLIAFFSCTKSSLKNNNENADKIITEDTLLISHCNEMQILDSMKYIYVLPQYYEIEGSKFYPHGDSICRKIITERRSEIIPCLIEKIKDTTSTEMEIIDSLNFTVSDIAIMLLPDVIRKNLKIEMDLISLLVDEFYKELNRNCNNFYISMHQNLFIFSNTQEENYKNRLRFYNRIKKWYEEDRDNWKLDISKCKDYIERNIEVMDIQHESEGDECPDFFEIDNTWERAKNTEDIEEKSTTAKEKETKRKVTGIYWMDCNEKNEISTIKKGQKVVLYVKTEGFNPGETVTISILNDVRNKEVSVSGTVDAQGLAKIKWQYK